jgi:hypothetical protein
MNDQQGDSSIECSVYIPSHAEEMTRLLAEAFAHREGLSIAAGLSKAQFAMFVRIASHPLALPANIWIAPRL